MMSQYFPNIQNIEQSQFSTVVIIGKSIRIIDKVRPCYHFVSKLYLDNNQLITLNGIEQFTNLELLSINFNHIRNFKQLSKIKNPFFIKELSVIGNPLQADKRAKFQYLKVNIFTNLQRYNPIQISKPFVYTKKRKHHQNIKQIHEDKYYQEKEEEEIRKTQRHRQNHMESIMTRRTKQKPYAVVSQQRPTQHKTKQQNYSTGLNRSNSPYFYSHTKQNYKHEHQQDRKHANKVQEQKPKKQIHINQFQTVAQSQGNQNLQQNLQTLQGQSQIKSNKYKDFSVSLFNDYQNIKNTNEQTNNKKFQQQQKNSNQFKGLALQFLEQQKNQIADAFRCRHVKEKVFQALKYIKDTTNHNQQLLKKKAWAAIKFFNTISRVHNI